MTAAWSWRCMLPALLLGMAWCSTPALAQENFPIKNFHLNPIHGDLFTTIDYRDDTDSRDGADTKTQSLYIREGINLKLDGYIYHPYLLEYGGDFRIGGLHQRSTINDDDFNSDGLLNGFNVAVLAFKQKPVSVRAFATRNDDFIDRNFARAVEQTVQTEGFEIYGKGPIPTSLLFEHRTNHEIDDLREQDEETILVRFTAADERNRDWLTRLVYEHEETDETITFLPPGGGAPQEEDLPDTRDELTITNRWMFGPAAHKHSLTGQFKARQRRGFFEQDLYLFDQRLDLNHSPTLSSFYHLLVNSDKTETQSDDAIAGEIGVRKQIYDSLTIGSRLTFSDRQVDDGTEQELGAFLDLDYRKFTPLGLYTSNLTLGREYEMEDFEAGQQRILDELIVLNGIAFTPLSNAGVDPTSINVTDVTNTITYVRDVDYIVRTTGAFVEIARVASGGILDGQPVLVDYTISAGNDSKFHTDTVRWRHRLALDDLPLAFYVEYRLRDQSLDSGDDPGNLNREQVILGGAELRIEDLLLIAEYQITEEELFPSYTSYRARANYARLLSDLHTVNLGADYELIQYEDADEFDLEADYLETYGAYLRVSTKLNRRLLLRGDASYYKTTGRDNSELIRIGGGIIWTYGLTEISFDAAHSIYMQEEQEGDRTFVGFTLRRFF